MTFPSRKPVKSLAAMTAASLALAGCALQDPAPPPRPSAIAGTALAGAKAASAYLAAHPPGRRPGMLAGILLADDAHGYVCVVGYCHTWHGVAIIPGGRVETLSSTEGNNDLSGVINPGDEFWFPAGGPVEASSDSGATEATAPVSVIAAGAVRIP